MKVTLPEPECQFGYTARQIADIFGPVEADFTDWMVGQTMTLCEGRRNGCERSHGPVVYTHDVRRYVAGLAPLD